MDPPRTFHRVHLVMNDGFVDLMNTVEFTEVESAASFDEMGFGRPSVHVTERSDDDGWEVDELGVDFEDKGSGSELRFDTMG